MVVRIYTSDFESKQNLLTWWPMTACLHSFHLAAWLETSYFTLRLLVFHMDSLSAGCGRITFEFHWMHVHCGTAPVRIFSVVWQPPPVVFWAQHCRTAWTARQRSSHHNYRIMTTVCVTYVLFTQCLDLSLFWDFCAGINRVFYSENYWMLCCCFGVWLPVYSVLNSAEFCCCEQAKRDRTLIWWM